MAFSAASHFALEEFSPEMVEKPEYRSPNSSLLHLYPHPISLSLLVFSFTKAKNRLFIPRRVSWLHPTSEYEHCCMSWKHSRSLSTRFPYSWPRSTPMRMDGCTKVGTVGITSQMASPMGLPGILSARVRVLGITVLTVEVG